MSRGPRGAWLPRSRQAQALSLFVFCFIFWGSAGGLWDLWGPDETRYVQIGKELLGRGNWLALTLHGEPYDQKPPLPFWLFAAMLKLGGGHVSSFLVRLPSAFFSALAVAMTYLIGRRLIGRRAGLLAALMTMTAPQVITDAPSAELNMMLTGWLTLAAWIWIDRPVGGAPLSWPRAAAFWGVVIAAFLTKGPPALLVAFSPIIGECVAARSGSPALRPRPFAGLPALLAAAGIWFFGEAQSAGWAFVRAQIFGETIHRSLSGSHAGPFWYYFPRLFGGIFAPWALLLIPAGVLLWKHPRSARRMASVIGWFAAPFIVFCLARGKREAYLLPIVPAMALLGSWGAERAGWGRRAFPRCAGALGGLALGIAPFAFIASVGLLARPDIAWYRRFYALPGHAVALAAAGALLGGAGIALLRSRRTGWTLAKAVAAMMAIGAFADYAVIRPSINPTRSARAFGERVEAALEHGEPVWGKIVYAVEKAEKPEYHVYGDYRVIAKREEQAMAAAPGAGRGLWLFRERDWKWNAKRLAEVGMHAVETIDASTDPMVIAEIGPGGSEEKPAEAPRFALLGDTGSGNKHLGRIARQMARLHGDTPLAGVVLLGDNLYGEESFDSGVARRFEEPFRPVLDLGVPFYAILGNHDIRPNAREKELDYPLFHMDGRAWYSKTFGGGAVTVFMLNSETLARDPGQYEWFRRALDRCDSKWRLLAIHHPLQASKIAHGPDRRLYRLLRPLMQGRNDIDVVFSGHNHVYERRKIEDGVQHITVGIGGEKEHEPLPPDDGRVVGEEGVAGFAVAEARGERLEVAVFAEDGRVIDRFTLEDEENPARVRVAAASDTARADNLDTPEGRAR